MSSTIKPGTTYKISSGYLCIDKSQARADIIAAVIRGIPLLSAEGIATVARSVEEALHDYEVGQTSRFEKVEE